MRRRLLGLTLALAAVLGTCTDLPAWASSFNVKNFGAVGDGQTDDTVAIQATIQAAANQGPGNDVLFPVGNYLFSSDLIASGVRLYSKTRATLTSTVSNAEVHLQSNSGVSKLDFATQDFANSAIVVDNNAFKWEIINCRFSNDFNVTISARGFGNSRGSIAHNTIGFRRRAISIGSSFTSISQNQIIHSGENADTSGIESGGSSNLLINGNHISNASNCIFDEQSTGTSIVHNALQPRVNGIWGISLDGGTIAQNSITGPGRVSRESVSVSAGIRLSGQGNSVRQNSITKVDFAIRTEQCSNTNIKHNTLSNVGTGVHYFEGSNITIHQNDVNDTQYQGIFAQRTGGTLLITHNTLSNLETGVQSLEGSNITIHQNNVNNAQFQGIFADRTGGTLSITDNALSNCGLGFFNQGNPAAVIYANGNVTSLPIQNNRYTGNTFGLQYYIWCVPPEPPASVTGNVTTTLLPNRIGF